MKRLGWILAVACAAGTAHVQAQMACDEEDFGTDYCIERERQGIEDAPTGAPTAIVPGLATPGYIIPQGGRQAEPRPFNEPIFGPDEDDFGGGFGSTGASKRYDVSVDSIGNYEARNRDGRVLYGVLDPYGELGWTDASGNPMDCELDRSGQLVCR